MADIKAVNPWTWQDKMDFSQGVLSSGGERILHCAGQTSVDGDGNLLHAGDMAGQLGRCFDNLETVLAQAGMSLRDVVRLNYYVTDMQAFFEAGGTVASRLGDLEVKPAGSLLGVAALSQPEALVEIEATAVA